MWNVEQNEMFTYNDINKNRGGVVEWLRSRNNIIVR